MEYQLSAVWNISYQYGGCQMLPSSLISLSMRKIFSLKRVSLSRSAFSYILTSFSFYSSHFYSTSPFSYSLRRKIYWISISYFLFNSLGSCLAMISLSLVLFSSCMFFLFSFYSICSRVAMRLACKRHFSFSFLSSSTS